MYPPLGAPRGPSEKHDNLSVFLFGSLFSFHINSLWKSFIFFSKNTPIKLPIFVLIMRGCLKTIKILHILKKFQNISYKTVFSSATNWEDFFVQNIEIKFFSNFHCKTGILVAYPLRGYFFSLQIAQIENWLFGQNREICGKLKKVFKKADNLPSLC